MPAQTPIQRLANPRSLGWNTPITGEDCVRQIALLRKRSNDELFTLWEEHVGKPANPKIRRELLILVLSYKMREQVEGQVETLADNRSAAELFQFPGATEKPQEQLGCGTRLLREWGGETHEVIAVEDGFTYRGQTYRSLSAIARKITGTQWSGPAFFGTKVRNATS